MLRTITILFLYLFFAELSVAQKSEVRKDSVWEVNKNFFSRHPFNLALGLGTAYTKVSYGVEFFKVSPKLGYQGFIRGEWNLNQRFAFGLSGGYYSTSSFLILKDYDSLSRPINNHNLNLNIQVASFFPFVKITQKVKDIKCYVILGLGVNEIEKSNEKIYYVKSGELVKVRPVSLEEENHFFYNCNLGLEYKIKRIKVFTEFGYARENSNWKGYFYGSYFNPIIETGPKRSYTNPNYSLQLNVGIRL